METKERRRGSVGTELRVAIAESDAWRTVSSALKKPDGLPPYSQMAAAVLSAPLVSSQSRCSVLFFCCASGCSVLFESACRARRARLRAWHSSNY